MSRLLHCRINTNSPRHYRCSGSTIYKSLIESELKAGDWAVFPGGGGGVGHMGVQIAKAMGMRVIAVDGGAEKRKLCEEVLKVDAFVDFTESKSVEEDVIKITGGKGANGVFVTAGSAAAYKSAPMMCGVGGRVMCIGLPPAALQVIAGVDPAWYVFKNLHIIGTMVGSLEDTNKALDFAVRVCSVSAFSCCLLTCFRASSSRSLRFMVSASFQRPLPN
jgi:propanol-preferring alcohol dehydrogenase